MIKLNCKKCNTPFEAYIMSKRRFCSKECYWLSLIGRKLPDITRERLSKSSTGRVMSEDTKIKIGKGNKGHFHSKETIEKIKLKRAQQIFPEGHYKRLSEILKNREGGMSQWLVGRKVPDNILRKRSVQMRGEKCHFWKGGKSRDEYSKIRGCLEYKIWRRKVFERDKYTCIICGYSKGHIIQADHIIPFQVLLNENKIENLEQAEKCSKLWDVNNGRTLCIPCHKKTDTWGYGTRKILNKLEGYLTDDKGKVIK